MAGTDYNRTVEVTSSSLVASLVAGFCLFTIVINLLVCYEVYRKRSLRSSSTALIVGNLAFVDVLVTIKDTPLLFSVVAEGRWYFEEEWCKSYGLTNVIYIVVSISTLATITTEQYLRVSSPRKSDSAANVTGRSIVLGYIIAHTTLSYSLSLLWSKYVFISRKAFCEVDWPPSGLSFTLFASVIFLIPISLLIFNLFDFENECEKSNVLQMERGNASENVGSKESRAHSRLQCIIGLFLIAWTPYVIESFFSYSAEAPNLIGTLCAFIPIVMTTLIPVWYLRWRKEFEQLNKEIAIPVYVYDC